VIYALGRVSEEMKRSEALRQTLTKIEGEISGVCVVASASGNGFETPSEITDAAS
jgi:hypothetical protein